MLMYYNYFIQTINNTVKKLTDEVSLKLYDICVNRFEKKPGVL